MVIEHLKEAQKWLAKAQHGDPNGAKAYQASKFVGYALQELEAAQQSVQRTAELCDHGKEYGECEILGCGHCYETRRR